MKCPVVSKYYGIHYFRRVAQFINLIYVNFVRVKYLKGACTTSIRKFKEIIEFIIFLSIQIFPRNIIK